MSRPMIPTVIFLTVALAIQAMANQPAYIQATKAEYTFSEIMVRMEQCVSKHFSMISISAFGKTHELSKELLSELDNYSCSGMTAMRGYDPVMKSQVIYLRLSMVVFEQTYPTAVIVVSENGEIKIRKTKQAKPPNNTLEGIRQPEDGTPKPSM